MVLFFLILEALGGIGLLILGMRTMTGGLQRLAGTWLKQSLDQATRSRFSALLFGTLLATFFQSSGAAAIITIGLVNAGLLSLFQSLAVLLGTVVGTSLVLHVLSLTLTSFALPAVFVGTLLTFFARQRRWVHMGESILGVGLLFLGMRVMEANFAPINQSAIQLGIQFNLFSSLSAALLLGGLITFLAQSSVVATGIIIVMAGSGMVPLPVAIAMSLGEVVGISLMALIGSIGGTQEGKRAALLYLTINLFASTLALTLIPLLVSTSVHLTSPGDNLLGRQIINAHALFSLSYLVITLPFVGFFVRLSTLLIPGRQEYGDLEPKSRFLDLRVLSTPSLAFGQARSEIARMTTVARAMFTDLVALLFAYDAKRADLAKQREEVLDVIQRDLVSYLVSLSQRPLTGDISASIPLLLTQVSELERFGDQAEAVLDYLRLKKERRVFFSDTAMDELKRISAWVGELVILTMGGRERVTVEEVERGDELLVQIRSLHDSMIAGHLQRLRGGTCTMDAGVLYSDILNAFVRMSESCCAILRAGRSE
jgi:phosphate:Na+ symporter